MKYAGKTFTLYASEPVAVQGSDSLYTYQNTGTGTATLQGSNNGKDWVTITTVTSGASSISSHSYAFLRMTGSTEVSVSRGEAGSGSTLLNGSAVSSGNPLPVVTYSNPKTSAIEASVIGKAFKAWVTAPATAAKYSAVQIWNPVGSGVNLVVPQIQGYNSSGTMKWYPILNQVQLTGATGFIQKMKPTGGAASFQILTGALNARTATDSFGITISSTTPNGAGLQVSNEFYTIPEGWGLRYEGETVNVGMNLITMIVESANT